MNLQIVAGAVVLPRMPATGSVWELRQVLPECGRPYRATVERVWRDREGRLVARFSADDDKVFISELWIQPPASNRRRPWSACDGSCTGNPVAADGDDAV